MFRYRHEDDLPVVKAALDIIRAWVTRLIEYALISNVQDRNPTQDSQEYGSDIFSDVKVEILEYVGVCDPSFPDYARPANSLLRLSTASSLRVYGMSCVLSCVLGCPSNPLLGRTLSTPGH